jgi:SsrA-binding protein
MPKKTDGIKIIAPNKKASHNYHLLERFEAGLVLVGSEVKSLRDGKVNLKDGYARIKDGEVWLEKVHISEYPMANIQNHEPIRPRKLLLKRSEIHKLYGKTQEKGLTLIPTKIYFKNGRAKVEIALAKGKKLYDKREDMRKKESRKVISKAMISRS